MPMNMETFCMAIKEKIQEELGDGFHISLNPVLKINGTRLTGLVIQTEGCSVSPSIYLDPYYREYANGRAGLGEITDSILECHRSKSQEGCSFDLGGLKRWETAKPLIACKLVSYNDNQELLGTTPHERFLDLAVICYYMVGGDPSATVLIQDSFLPLWGIDRDELLRAAKENTPCLLMPVIRGMGEVIAGLEDVIAGLPGSWGLCGAGRMAETGMYVLTNRHALNGSVCILYPGLLKGLADRLQDDLCIIPSSIHEVLIIPAGKTAGNREWLSQMVQEVNRTQLEREEALADHVYYYSRADDLITMQRGSQS